MATLRAAWTAEVQRIRQALAASEAKATLLEDTIAKAKEQAEKVQVERSSVAESHKKEVDDLKRQLQTRGTEIEKLTQTSLEVLERLNTQKAEIDSQSTQLKKQADEIISLTALRVEQAARIEESKTSLDSEVARRTKAEDELKLSNNTISELGKTFDEFKSDTCLKSHIDWLDALKRLEHVMKSIDAVRELDPETIPAEGPPEAQCDDSDDLHALHSYIKEASDRHTHAFMQSRWQVASQPSTSGSQASSRKRRRVTESS
ncbi:hypothetical protein HGRIS_006777 [Hohenbuehelia grisea]